MEHQNYTEQPGGGSPESGQEVGPSLAPDEASFTGLGVMEASILKAIPHAVLGLRERVIVFANDAVQAVFGWRPDELIGKSTRVLYRSDEEYEKIGRGYPLLKNHGTYGDRIICRHKAGHDLACRLSVARVGGILCKRKVVAVYEDITEQIQTWEALCASEEKYRNIYQNAVVGIFQSTPEGVLLNANPALARMYGYDSPEEMLRITDIRSQIWVQPEERDRYRGLLEKYGSLQGFQAHALRKDGSRMWISLDVGVVRDAGGKPLRYEGIALDITEHKRAEMALQESEEKFRTLFEKTTDAILLSDGSTYIDCNEAALRLVGAPSKDRLIGLSPFDLSPERQPDGRLSRDKGRELLKAALKKGVHRFEWLHRDFKGEEFWTEVALTAIPIHGTRVFYTVWRDIRERKKAEMQLRESEERYRVAIENSNDGVALLRRDKHIYVNDRFVSIFGYEKAEELVGRSLAITVHEDDREMIMGYNSARQQGKPAPSRYEFKGIRKNGTIVHIEASVAALTFREEPATLVYMRDITDRKRAEEEKAVLESQLRQSQKMEAVGTLAGGIAHDFNNILTVLIGCGGLLRMKMAAEDPLRLYVDQMLTSAERAANLTQSLLTFSRKQPIHPKAVRLHRIVKDVSELLKRLVTEDIELRISLEGDDPVIMADETQIDEVLINLVSNARDAMPKGGILTIATGTTTVGEEFVNRQGYGVTGRYAMLSVADTGTGMDAKTREHIFEPFFTTKEVGRGTGLGLSTAYGIVKQHNGFITVSSEPKKGATFRIYLPLSAGHREQAAAKHEVRGGTETILIAEDDPAVMKFTGEMLRAYGYSVIEATDGQDAVDMFVKNKDRTNLVIVDVVMPRKSGKEAYEDIKKVRPDTKVIFASGYTRDVIIDKGIYGDKVDFISKPLSAPDLLKKVREVLDK